MVKIPGLGIIPFLAWSASMTIYSILSSVNWTYHSELPSRVMKIRCLALCVCVVVVVVVVVVVGCSGSQLQHSGSSFLTRDQTPGPLHWECSLNHWTTKEVPELHDLHIVSA